MYRLLIYCSSKQCTVRSVPQVHVLAVPQCSSRRRDKNTTTATSRNAAAVDYERNFAGNTASYKHTDKWIKITKSHTIFTLIDHTMWLSVIVLKICKELNLHLLGLVTTGSTAFWIVHPMQLLVRSYKNMYMKDRNTHHAKVWGPRQDVRFYIMRATKKFAWWTYFGHAFLSSACLCTLPLHCTETSQSTHDPKKKCVQLWPILQQDMYCTLCPRCILNIYTFESDYSSYPMHKHLSLALKRYCNKEDANKQKQLIPTFSPTLVIKDSRRSSISASPPLRLLFCRPPSVTGKEVVCVSKHENTFALKVPDMIHNIIPPNFFKPTVILVPKV